MNALSQSILANRGSNRAHVTMQGVEVDQIPGMAIRSINETQHPRTEAIDVALARGAVQLREDDAAGS